MQASKNKITFLQTFNDICQKGNNKNKGLFKTFYSGFHLALLRAIPLHATAFMTMEYLSNNQDLY